MLSAAYTLHRPSAVALPIVVDSPHSGSDYPPGFQCLATPAQLRQAEDAFVDALYAHAPAYGASLLAARFARLYIDPNRSLQDLDPLLLDGRWPEPLQPGEKARLGIGLVWRLLEGKPLYRAPLPVAEVQRRIEHCWRPYHQALQALLDDALALHGARWHLNVHSMPDDSYRLLGMHERPLADFVLGNRDGSTSDEATMDVLEDSLRASGFTVARNDPFKGVEIVRHSGHPARHCHAVQVEVKKSLYMDTKSHQPHDGFAEVQAAIDRMLQALAAHAQRELAGR